MTDGFPSAPCVSLIYADILRPLDGLAIKVRLRGKQSDSWLRQVTPQYFTYLQRKHMKLPKAQILLAEDNPHDLRLALEAFTRNKLAHLVHTVGDGVQALEFLAGVGSPAAAPVKLALLDLKLPKISGLEVLRRMRLEQRMRRIPVVMLSSSAGDRDLAFSYEAGANSCVVKPVECSEFTELLRVLCRYWLVLNRTPETPR